MISYYLRWSCWKKIKAVWIARNCSMHLEEYGEERWVVTKPFTIFSKQLVHEIVT